MKTYLLPIIFFAACLSCLKVSAMESEANFHAAQSSAEKTIDSIVRMSESDPAIINFLINNGPEKNVYTSLFTPALLQAFRVAQVQAKQKDCDGQAEAGEICGLDFNPVSCAQDMSDADYLYKTRSNDTAIAIIASEWPRQNKTQPVRLYRLVESRGHWVLDGINCGNDVKFNMN